MPGESMREWLAAIGLERYGALFEESRIGADVLEQLTDQDLKDLGIPLGDRKRLLVAIQAGVLRAAPSPVLCAIGFAKMAKIDIPEEHRNLLRWYAAVSARPSASA